MTAAAFPIATGDRCAGVVELYSTGVHEPNPEVSAMFAAVGSQVAQYLERRRRAAGSTPPRRRCSRSTRGARAAGQRERVRARRAAARTIWSAPSGPSTRSTATEWSRGSARRSSRTAARSARGRPAPCARRRPADSVEARLRRALGGDELRLHYQPIFALRSGELVALEALLRWEDPVRGMISPAEFIPVAEQTGLIDALGDWVLEAVCAQQVEWTERGLLPHISFNVSPSAAAPRRLPGARARADLRAAAWIRPAHGRAHRVLDARGSGAGRDRGPRARRARAADRARRLRHRLLVAVAAARAARHRR